MEDLVEFSSRSNNRRKHVSSDYTYSSGRSSPSSCADSFSTASDNQDAADTFEVSDYADDLSDGTNSYHDWASEPFDPYETISDTNSEPSEPVDLFDPFNPTASPPKREEAIDFRHWGFLSKPVATKEPTRPVRRLSLGRMSGDSTHLLPGPGPSAHPLASTTLRSPLDKPHAAIVPPSPAPRILSLLDALLEDGDVQFRTTDGVIIGAHSFILQAASPHFRGPSAWHKVRDSPITLDHDSFALRTLLKLLYPADERPPTPSLAQLVSILKAAKALHLTSFVIRDTLDAWIQTESHPLRAWALATAFGYPDAQRSAIERYFKSDSSFHDDIPEEMRLVDAFQILQLNAAKERASGRPKDHQEGSPPAVPEASPESGLNPAWHCEFVARRVNLNPFRTSATSEMLSSSVTFCTQPVVAANQLFSPLKALRTLVLVCARASGISSLVKWIASLW